MCKKRCVSSGAQCTDPYQWISEVLHFCQGLPIILVACKKDLREDPKTQQDLSRMNQRPVSKAEGLAVAQKIGAQGYVECSAKSGEGVREVFQTATRNALMVRLLSCRSIGGLSSSAHYFVRVKD
jgi:Ras family protein A